MNRAERAAEYHKKGYNCAQAILCTYCDKLGISEQVVRNQLSVSLKTLKKALNDSLILFLLFFSN